MDKPARLTAQQVIRAHLKAWVDRRVLEADAAPAEERVLLERLKTGPAPDAVFREHLIRSEIQLWDLVEDVLGVFPCNGEVLGNGMNQC